MEFSRHLLPAIFGFALIVLGFLGFILGSLYSCDVTGFLSLYYAVHGH